MYLLVMAPGVDQKSIDVHMCVVVGFVITDLTKDNLFPFFSHPFEL